MLIRELEKNTGLERATIRFYEKEGFITPTRHENGYREYSDADRDTLLKVKLLRQLGMPLEMIRGLQQGSEDFTTAMSDQIHMLENKLQDTARAKEVCVELRDAGVSYEALDAAYYLHELTRVRPAEPAWKPQTVPEFRQKPVTHPWRRFFARSIDYTLLNVIELFVLVVILRIRPVNAFIYSLINFTIFSYMLWIPIEGVLLHYFGTTPGKWVMGIRVESINGGRLSISAAMHRAWGVLRYGFGFTIPIYDLWRQYRSYKDYVDYGYALWDQEWDAEVQFHYYYDVRKKVMIAGLAVLYLLVFGLSMNDIVKPVHRGEDLTVAQIAENYNNYLETAYEDDVPPYHMYMSNTGQWRNFDQNNTPGNAVLVIGSTATGGDGNYQYGVEDGFVRTITYEQSWTDISYLMPIDARVQYTIAAIAGAQDWMTLQRFYEFADLLSNELTQQNGLLIYENLEISWSVETENCVLTTSGIYFSKEENTPSSLHLQFELKIHETK